MVMKKVTAMVLGIAMIGALTACSNTVSSQQTGSKQVTEQQTSENNSDKIAGGWENNQGSLKLDDNKEAKAAFEKAMQGMVGYKYEVIAYLGSQVVQGTNYAYLCRGTPVVPDAKAEYLILDIYEDLKGNTRITGTKQLLEVSDKNADGGWSYNQGDAVLDKNKDVKSAFDKAAEGLAGVDYKPIYYIGSQVTAGSNYAIFCSAAPVVPDAEKKFCIAYVSVDLDGNAKITDDKDVDLTAETENSEESTEVQMPNPFTEVSTLSEAAGITGFDLTVPKAPAEYPDMIIRVMDNTMIEVIFVNKANKTDVGQDEGYRIRKESGSDDISGDYNKYANTDTETINNIKVTLKGNDQCISTATWSADGYTYAVDAKDHPLSKDAMTEVISTVK